jgi:MoxR-like ATPase
MSASVSTHEQHDIARAKRLRTACDAVRQQIAKVVVGQDETIEQLMIAILARGHCLLQGVPGLAKTLMVKSLADAMELTFHRIQFTPDLMPADITGTDIIQESPQTGHRQLTFQKGPVFTQMLLADEINRTPPKTQAALLEAMQEHEVTVGGKTYKLAEPFFVLATQNPIEQEGTYPLPEAQRDRFLFQVIVRYPSFDQEAEIIDRTTSTYATKIEAVLKGEEIVEFQETVRLVPLPDHCKQMILTLVRSLRPDEEGAFAWVKDKIDWGPGPRACQQLVLASKARALLQGRYHVTINDIETLALPVLRHRIVPSFAAQAEGLTSDDLIAKALRELPRPTGQLL